MRAVKYLFALWTGTFVYALLSINFGAVGLSVYRQMETEQEKELVDVESLRQFIRNLENTRDALLFDRDTLTVYAREQGFAPSNERFVRIVGLGNTPRISNTPGEIVAARPPEYTPDLFIRIFSFCAALTVLVCMGAYDLLRYLKDR
jgi:hypothetical protein